MNHLLKTTWVLAIPFMGSLVSSCTNLGDSWMIGSMAAAAKNQIMLVREEPASFGYQRLITLSREYPDLTLFVTKRGLPDFLAETGEKNQQYFILYYLQNRQAFACRTRQKPDQGLEFAGPYPITDREFRALDNFRRDPSKKQEKF